MKNISYRNLKCDKMTNFANRKDAANAAGPRAGRHMVTLDKDYN